MAVPDSFPAIGSRRVGDQEPCLVIAEAGVNHNGDRDMAHQLVDAAADCGADAVKFQTWITEELCAPGAAKAKYQERTGHAAEDQFTMLKRLELPFAWHSELKEHAERRGIIFLSTPDEISSARFLCDLGVEALKIGSAEVTNLPYLADLAALGKPLILSTGMATLEEVSRAFSQIRRVNPEAGVALLHCVSAYPAPEEEMNLRCIATLRREFRVPAGLSDHTTGRMAALLGTGAGMSIYERHITLNRGLPGPDQACSTEPHEFAEVVRDIRRAETMLGSGVKERTPSEENTANAVRRSLVYRRDLTAGEEPGEGDLTALRSGRPGIPPSDIGAILGRALRRAVRAGDVADSGDFF